MNDSFGELLLIAAIVFIVSFVCCNKEQDCMQRTCPVGYSPVWLQEDWECICAVRPK